MQGAYFLPKEMPSRLHSPLSSLLSPSVHRLPELHPELLHEGHPCDGAFHRPVQRGLPVGSADGAQQANGSASSGGFHKVHPRGKGSFNHITASLSLLIALRAKTASV